MTAYRALVIARCGVMGVVALGLATIPEVGGLGLLVAAICWSAGLWLWWSAF